LVSFDTIIGTDKIPAQVASLIHKAVDKMMLEWKITKKNKWQTLEYIVANYLAGE